MRRLGNVVAPCLSACLWLVLPAAAHALSPVTCADRPELVTLALDADEPAPAAAVDAAPLRTHDEESVPWCAREGDPSCSPIDPGSLPREVSAQPKLSSAAPLPMPMPPATSVCSLRPRFVVGVPREGTHGRLERPPRLP